MIVADGIEGDVSGWTIEDTGVSGGTWVQAVPNGTLAGTGEQAAPDEDAEPGPGQTHAFVTGNGAPGGAASASDVDGGPTELISAAIDLAGADGIVSYECWFFCDDAADPGQRDPLVVAVSGDDGQSWTTVETITDTDGWSPGSFRVGNFVPPSAAVRVRLSVSDSPNNSVTEAGLDAFRVERLLCPAGSGPGRVPDGASARGVPLTLERVGEAIRLSWGASCRPADTDYGVYEGTLGSFTSHVARLCSTAGSRTAELTPAAGNTYYLVVPNDEVQEGSYGTNSSGVQRPPSNAGCFPQSIGPCGL